MTDEILREHIEPQRNYGICEAAQLCGKDRHTLLGMVKQYPAIFPVTFDPISHRKRIKGSILIAIKNKTY